MGVPVKKKHPVCWKYGGNVWILHPGAWVSISQSICYRFFWKHPQGPREDLLPFPMFLAAQTRVVTAQIESMGYWVMVSVLPQTRSGACLRKELLKKLLDKYWSNCLTGFWFRPSLGRSWLKRLVSEVRRGEKCLHPLPFPPLWAAKCHRSRVYLWQKAKHSVICNVETHWIE